MDYIRGLHPFTEFGSPRHANSGVAPAKRGSYAGLIEKVPYLRDLGITAVELLPVFHFDPTTAAPGLVNYWESEGVVRPEGSHCAISGHRSLLLAVLLTARDKHRHSTDQYQFAPHSSHPSNVPEA